MQPNEQSQIDRSQVPHFSSFMRSSLDVKTKHLTDFLINQIGLTKRSAVILMDVHRCETKVQVLELLTLDDNNFFNHVFVPTSGQNHQTCEVCGDLKQRHKIYDLNEPQEQNPVYSSFIFEEQFSQQRPNNNQRRSLSSHPVQRRHLDDQMMGNNIFQQSWASESVLCQICYITYDNQDIATFLQQKHSICKACMTAHVDQKIVGMEIQSIICPHCGIKLTQQLIKQFASPNNFTVYEKFIKNLEIQKNPNLMWCPNPKCAIVISIQKKKKIFQCPKCLCKICSKCKNQSHGSKSCNSVFENEIRKWQNSQSIQRCKKCSSIVQKVSGCNHMSCSICGHEWCWLCGSDYSDRHFSPLNPFGCAGLQNRDDVGNFRIWLWRIVLFLLILVAFPAAIPMTLIFSGPFVAIDFCYKKVQYNRSCAQKILAVVFGFIIGFIFNPIIWIGLIIQLGPRVIRGIREHFRSRRRRRENTQNRLNQRLINDAIVNSQNLVVAVEDNR